MCGCEGKPTVFDMQYICFQQSQKCASMSPDMCGSGTTSMTCKSSFEETLIELDLNIVSHTFTSIPSNEIYGSTQFCSTRIVRAVFFLWMLCESIHRVARLVIWNLSSAKTELLKTQFELNRLIGFKIDRMELRFSNYLLSCFIKLYLPS